MRVLAAMSGGVDSAVAAARVKAAGHEVVGVHLALARDRATNRTGARGCCTIEDATDARRVADLLEIPFYVWDLAERFDADVVQDFVAEYAAGRTPNPCVRCNQKIKFSALLDKAVALGFDAVATGHYAAVRQTPDGPELARAADAAKDQSYVLAVVEPERLRRAIFPLGDVPGKDVVRAEAAALGLGVAAKPDSHDICFIPDGDTRGFLSGRLNGSVGSRPGPILDTSGTQVGEHSGAAGHTIGQRRGLRLGHPAPDGRPRYVLDVSVVDNTVTVGSAAELAVEQVLVSAMVWHAPVERGQDLRAQVRAHGVSVPARLVDLERAETRIGLHVPLTGVAPGQSLVLYDESDRRVVGAGTVESTVRAAVATR
ncbi:MAG: tRNA 2-thiouridine(34) synthase MnmA [Actinomycetales bacterium]